MKRIEGLIERDCRIFPSLSYIYIYIFFFYPQHRCINSFFRWNLFDSDGGNSGLGFSIFFSFLHPPCVEEEEESLQMMAVSPVLITRNRS